MAAYTDKKITSHFSRKYFASMFESDCFAVSKTTVTKLCLHCLSTLSTFFLLLLLDSSTFDKVVQGPY